MNTWHSEELAALIKRDSVLGVAGGDPETYPWFLFVSRLN